MQWFDWSSCTSFRRDWAQRTGHGDFDLHLSSGWLRDRVIMDKDHGFADFFDDDSALSCH